MNCTDEPQDHDLIAAAAAQLVEHVAADGTVLEIVTRADMRARSLRHRSVYVAVVNSQGALLVHKRADWKDVFPGAWDLAFGGVCDVGEDWETSAHRELLEEAGAVGRLYDRGAVSFEATDVALIGRLYVCRHDGPFAFNDGEVTDTQWVALDDLEAFVAANDIPPDSIQKARERYRQGHERRTASGSFVKADLYSAQAQTASGSGLAHRTAAGFAVLTSGDGAELIALIDAQQNEPNLIDQVVAAAANGPASFSMLFTAGGELFLIASGAATATVESDSAQLTISPAGGSVLVHQVAVGINEASATVRLSNGSGVSVAAHEPLVDETVPADMIQISIGGHQPSAAAAASAPVVEQKPPEVVASEAPPAAQDIVFADDLVEPTTAEQPLPPEAAAAAPEAAPAAEPAAEPSSETAAPASDAADAPAPANVGAVMVLGVACSQGHHNHPDAVYCSQCGTKMGVHHTTVLMNGPRPPLGVLVVDDGSTYSLSEDLVIGREPTSHEDVVAGSASPMILVDDTLSMSRKHARIVLEDWSGRRGRPGLLERHVPCPRRRRRQLESGRSPHYDSTRTGRPAANRWPRHPGRTPPRPLVRNHRSYLEMNSAGVRYGGTTLS
ncbi:putative Nudix hydrolase YfcD [Nymphon striatum]|nr:putative Nudix hydrolase YfcD [Nymphon striatum]